MQDVYKRQVTACTGFTTARAVMITIFTHNNPHFCTRFLGISNLCQVCADTNLVCEKSDFSHYPP